MTDFFQDPTQADAPKQTSTIPWQFKVDYKSGKTPEGFAKKAIPEDVNAGFSYYDKEQKQKFQLGKFTATIVAMTSGISGTVPDGDRYRNYWSNLVFDSRDQIIEVSTHNGDGFEKVAHGIYNDIKATLPNGVGYCKVAICWIHETAQFVSIQLSSSLEQAIKEAISEKTKQRTSAINLFNLFELSNRFWAFRFSGEFSKRQKDGAIWSEKGDMFFYPTLSAGIVTTESFDFLPELRKQVESYVESFQQKFTKSLPGPDKMPQTEPSFDEPIYVPRPLPHPDTVFSNNPATSAPFDAGNDPGANEIDSLPF